jgi:hypothetical protein
LQAEIADSLAPLLMFLGIVVATFGVEVWSLWGGEPGLATMTIVARRPRVRTTDRVATIVKP